MAKEKTFKAYWFAKPEDERQAKFLAKHPIKVTPDANGNGDDVFTGKNKEMAEREPYHGFSPGNDLKVYESEELREEREIPLSHRHKHNVSHYRVLNNGRDVTRHDTYDEAKDYAAKHRAKLKKEGLRSNEVTVHAYVKEEVQEEGSDWPKSTLRGWMAADKKANRIADADRKRREKAEAKKPKNEEVENLDELSKKTLGSYIKNARFDASHHASESGRINQMAADYGVPHKSAEWNHREEANKKHGRRSGGIERAVNKLTGQAKVNVKEEVLDELSSETLMAYAKKARKDRDTSSSDEKVGRRVSGLQMAIDRHKQNRAKPQYEEIEALDELSKKTLKSYMIKAGGEASSADKSAKELETKGLRSRDKNYRKYTLQSAQARKQHMEKRFKGMMTAASKLSEETESLDEGKNHASALSKLQKQMRAVRDAHNKQFQKDMSSVLKDNGYKKTHEGPTITYHTKADGDTMHTVRVQKNDPSFHYTSTDGGNHSHYHDVSHTKADIEEAMKKCHYGRRYY